jgi:hypothetical protein
MKITPNDIAVTIQNEYRPCLAEGNRAIFHKWIDYEETFLKLDCTITSTRFENIKDLYDQNILPNNCNLIKVNTTAALVELEDGTMKKVDIESIRFVDSFEGRYVGDVADKGN